MKTDLDMTLYLVTDSTYHTEETFYKTIEETCQGGVTLVQLREKNCGGREYLEKAMKVKAITDRYQIPLIIDDRVDVAIACDAAGVHVGSSDLPVAVARKLLGPDKIVGATAKTVEAAKKAYKNPSFWYSQVLLPKSSASFLQEEFQDYTTKLKLICLQTSACIYTPLHLA